MVYSVVLQAQPKSPPIETDYGVTVTKPKTRERTMKRGGRECSHSVIDIPSPVPKESP